MRKKLEQELAEIRTNLELVKTIVMVREPATGLAAEAYEGLRKQVIVAAGDRSAHLQQLARLDAEVSRGATIESIQLLLDDLLSEAGLARVREFSAEIEAAFDVVGGRGDSFRVVEPAYIENAGHGQPRLVRSGKVERVSTEADSLAAEPESVGVSEEQSE